MNLCMDSGCTIWDIELRCSSMSSDSHCLTCECRLDHLWKCPCTQRVILYNQNQVVKQLCAGTDILLIWRVSGASERKVYSSPPWSLMWLDVQYWRGLDFGIVNYNTADVYPPERLTWRHLVNGARQSCVCLIIFCLQIRSRGIRGVRLLGGSLW